MTRDKCQRGACRTPLPEPLRTPIKLDGVKIKFTVQICPKCGAEYYSSIKDDT